MLLENIKAQIQTSLKSGDHFRVETLRFLLAAIRNTAIAKYGNKGEAAMTDPDVIDVIKKQAKTRKESIDAFTKAGRTDLSDKEEKELALLQEFLPKELTDDEIKSLLSPLATSGEKNFGLLMGQAMKLVAGKANGDRVSQILKQLI